MLTNDLESRQIGGGSVTGSWARGYCFHLPKIPKGKYALAQVDDYMQLPRCKFPQQPPLRLRLEARVSAAGLVGTWGFGLWNDPFSLGFGGGGMARMLPALPAAVWYFYGSEHNHLTLNDSLPGSGFHAKTFRSPRIPAILSVLALPGLPFLLWPVTARLIRQLAGRLVNESVYDLPDQDQTWHTYEMIWQTHEVVFVVDGEAIMRTSTAPTNRLGLVIWMDNQYFRFSPQGRIGFGFLEVPGEQWLEVRGLSLKQI